MQGGNSISSGWFIGQVGGAHILSVSSFCGSLWKERTLRKGSVVHRSACMVERLFLVSLKTRVGEGARADKGLCRLH